MASAVPQNTQNPSERTAIYQHSRISTRSHLIIITTTTMESRTLTELDKL
jgi:hypothetical protein